MSTCISALFSSVATGIGFMVRVYKKLSFQWKPCPYSDVGQPSRDFCHTVVAVNVGLPLSSREHVDKVFVV